MKIASDKLIEDLIKRTRHNIAQAEKLRTRSLADLNEKRTPTSWSALECLEHLNLYGDFYLPEIKTRLSNNQTTAEPLFKAGILGNYFANAMLPSENMHKMKTFKDKNPNGSSLRKTCIDRFLSQQEQLLELLERSRKFSLNKTKTAVSISKFIKLKLGDTFRVLIYHNQRHILQAYKAVGAEAEFKAA
ncbi:DinB family protein [Salinimicrobium soli]|uniref:DinB family protein n=1 Tax=Salinimicrobium soli TaxID=1254399 RepID=UPI003AB0EE92